MVVIYRALEKNKNKIFKFRVNGSSYFELSAALGVSTVRQNFKIKCNAACNFAKSNTPPWLFYTFSRFLNKLLGRLPEEILQWNSKEGAS